MGGKHDDKKWDINWEHLFPKVSDKRNNDIKDVDFKEFRVYFSDFLL